MSVFDDAVLFAVAAHSGQVRKGTKIPYIVHPLEVAAIVGGYSADDDVLAAAVLHDTVEDAGIKLDALRDLFGDRVADLVAVQSEDKRRGVPAEDSWKIRKQETIDDIRNASRDAKLICLGDKLSNIRSMARDFDSVGDALWSRFNQRDKAMHAWYYGSILEIMSAEFGDIQAVTEFRSHWNKLFG